jgi:hypothetical protein
MPRHTGPVLVDTNVILECWRVGSWRALAGGYGVETVEDCVTETQTGFQRRRPEQQINMAELRASRARIHEVSREEIAAASVRDEMVLFLDVGGIATAAEQTANGSPFNYGRTAQRLLHVPLDPALPNLSTGHRRFVAGRSMRDVEPNAVLKLRDPYNNAIAGADDAT